MLTLFLSSSLMIHSCYPNINVDELQPEHWELSEMHQYPDSCPKEKIGCS